MVKKVLMVAIMASAVGAALAAGSEKSWPQEPESFIGISLSKSLADNMPQCSGENQAIVYKSLCRAKEFIPNYSFIYGGPEIGIKYSLIAKTRGSQIQNISMDVGERDFNKLLLIFVEKYGKPTIEEVQQIQTKRGVNLDNEIYTWKGAKVAIRLDHYSGNINTSSAMIFNLEVVEAASRDNDRKISDGASKL